MRASPSGRRRPVRAPPVRRDWLLNASPPPDERYPYAATGCIVTKITQCKDIDARPRWPHRGFEALAAMARTPFAVLMDCQLPGPDGYAATEAIRRRESGSSRTPVIAMTAGAVERDRERCPAAGMDDYIAKPIERDELSAVLAR